MMNIDSVNLKNYLKDSGLNVTANLPKNNDGINMNNTEKRGDSLEISSTKMNPVQTKMQSGFYSKPDVIRQVAQRLNKEIAK